VNATFWSVGRSSLLAGLLAGIILLSTATPQASWVLVLACLGGLGLYGLYLWSVEVPRLKVLWEYR
jgi:hypothetical protein